MPGGRVSSSTVPDERPRVPLGDHGVVRLVVEHELEVRELDVEQAPPLVEDVTVQVVLRPDRRGVDAALPQIGPFGRGVHRDHQLSPTCARCLSMKFTMKCR